MTKTLRWVPSWRLRTGKGQDLDCHVFQTADDGLKWSQQEYVQGNGYWLQPILVWGRSETCHCCKHTNWKLSWKPDPMRKAVKF